MTTATHTITYLSLMQKYNGDIKRAHPDEMRAAARTLNGKNALTALFDATREYERTEKKGQMDVYMSHGDFCEEDHCRCGK